MKDQWLLELIMSLCLSGPECGFVIGLCEPNNVISISYMEQSM